MFKRMLIALVAVGLLAGCDMSKGIDAAGDAYKSVTMSDAEVQDLGRQVAAQMDQGGVGVQIDTAFGCAAVGMAANHAHPQ